MTTTGTAARVYVVDDDEMFRKSLHWLLESVGLQVAAFATAAEFLDAYRAGDPGCLVLDIRMPGMSGLQLQDELAARAVRLPIVFLTAHGDVPMAVAAVKKGAVDFVQKPYNDQRLLDVIQGALQRDADTRAADERHRRTAALIAAMTPREREVMNAVVAGKTNKIIADELGVAVKTIEAHRARMMDKMGASSVAELVRLVTAIDAGPSSG
ncbi:MAG TPA: response regulator transcription factor [Burkholderiales bacterium]|nr:response regulator transcription factor [Burkholderiales bacterium]